MIPLKATSFAPGHISGFFEPRYQQQDIDRSGSRGSGINISLGALSEAIVRQSLKQKITINVNNHKASAPVTQLAIKHLIGDTLVDVTVNTDLDLPVGQGFGMSGAGALSATLALSKVLELSREKSIKASHYAEVQLRTGLSDVLASSFGGIEIRREAGLPPWGVIEHIPGKYELVLCVVGKRIDTRKILSDLEKMNEILTYGRYCTKKILEHPTLENLFSLSQMFATKIKLVEPKVAEAIEQANQYGMASMCMLGNSVFAVGDTLSLSKTLSSFGKVYVCSVDQSGARILSEK